MPKNRIVLSGGPGTGKTSLINELAGVGHHCFPEVSREIIDREVKLNSGIVPWDNLNEFTRFVLEGRITQYNQAPSGISFYDRSIIDSLAYMNLDGLDIPANWKEYGVKYQYQKIVFITPPWKDIYSTDKQRKESYDKMLGLHNELINSYEEYGYSISIVPKGSIKERVDFILDNIK